MIKLGSLVRDNISGFSGVAVARTHHLHGCTHISILPTELDKAGAPRPAATMDEQRVEVTGVHPAFKDYVERNVNPMLGYKVQLKVSGFTGIVGAYKERVVGSDEIFIEADKLDNEGNLGPACWTTIDAVNVVEAKGPQVSADANKPQQGGYNIYAMM